jgi:hypothetical protein
MIIGLCGKKQSGKTSVTNYLLDSKDFQEISWAAPLKEIIGRDLFGLTFEQVYGSEVDKETPDPFWGISPREILQRVGTDLFRNNFDSDFWVKVGARRIEHLISGKLGGTPNIVVSDCRFPNEVVAIRDLGGYTVRIIRSDQVSTDTHDSETALDDYETDYELQAESGKLVDLFKGIDNVLEDIVKNKFKKELLANAIR